MIFRRENELSLGVFSGFIGNSYETGMFGMKKGIKLM